MAEQLGNIGCSLLADDKASALNVYHSLQIEGLNLYDANKIKAQAHAAV